MDEIKTGIPESKINLKTISLQTSNFRRGDISDPGKLTMALNINTEDKNDSFFVTEKITLTSDQSKDFFFEVEMLAEFTKSADFNIPLEDFGHVNAAAIIYAYIRQHISTTTLQAGIKPLILPILNFFEHHRNKVKE